MKAFVWLHCLTSFCWPPLTPHDLYPSSRVQNLGDALRKLFSLAYKFSLQFLMSYVSFLSPHCLRCFFSGCRWQTDRKHFRRFVLHRISVENSRKQELTDPEKERIYLSLNRSQLNDLKFFVSISANYIKHENECFHQF